MKPKPKKLIEESMDDAASITDDEDAGNSKEEPADAFDSLFSSPDESASKQKANGNKSAPSPVKGLSSDEEDDAADNGVDGANATNGDLNSTNNDDDDDANNTSQESVKGDTADEDSQEHTADGSTAGEEEKPEEEEEEEGWEVEAIVGHKYKNGRRIYRLRWKNFTEADDTWQKEDDLSW